MLFFYCCPAGNRLCDNVSLSTQNEKNLALYLNYGFEVIIKEFIGPMIKEVWENAFRHSRSCFSYQHPHFVEDNGQIAGMASAYSCECKRKEEMRSLLMILRYLKWGVFKRINYMRRSGDILAQIGEDDYYLSNLATYPDFRGRGLVTRLLKEVEKAAQGAGCKRMVIDVETANERAIKLYERLGYSIELKSPVLSTRDRDFELFKMSKELVQE